MPKEKSEHQAESEKDGASSRSDIFPVGADGGTREDSSQAEKIDTSRASPQGNREESTDGGAEAAPGLSLSRIIADFSISTSKKKRKHEEGGHKGPSDAKGTPSTTSTDIRAREVIAEWNADGGDGDDPELGCICGDIHEEPEPVFWLHCDTCESWYNNSVRCLGFDQEAADKLKEWTCASCGGNPAIPHEGTKKKVSDEDKDNYDDEDDDDILPIGARVNVLVGKDLWKGTIHRVGRKHGDVYYRVHLDGNRKATLTTVFSHDIHGLITEPEVDKQDEQTDRCDSPLTKDADDAGTSKRPSDVAFGGNDSDSESEQEPPPKKMKVGKTEPPANLSKPQKTSVGDEDSEESEFVITESEALFLSGNIGNQKVHGDLGAGSEEQCTSSGGDQSQPLKVDGGSTLESSNDDEPPEAKAQNKPKPPKKPIFETIEEIDEDIIEFKDCGKIERRRIDWDHTPISVGSLVRVADRSAGTNGGNKLGGVAKVMGRRGTRSENNLVYDLRYVIGANREFDVSWRYVVPNSAFDSTGSGDGGDNGRNSSRRSRKSKRSHTEPSVSENGGESSPFKVKLKLSTLPLDNGGIYGH